MRGVSRPLVMTRYWILVLAAFVCRVAPASAHPAPFSFVDIRVESSGVEVTAVLHAWDLAHELGLDSPGQVLDPSLLAARGNEVVALLRDRLTIEVDGNALVLDEWSHPVAIHERQSLELTVRRNLERGTAVVSVDAELFSYDPQHQTFLNFYTDDVLTSQAILDADQTTHEYFVGTLQGRFAVVQKFVPAGVHHILIGPDHLLFLIGLLLLGGSVRRLALVVTGFTLAHSVTLSLAVLGVVAPPNRIVEAVIALSIVYVGVDNLMVQEGRDMRAWIAVVFGFIHGFGFASVLQEMGLVREALGWSLFSFNLGVEVGQLMVVIIVAVALGLLRAWSAVAARRVAYVGSIGVIAAGSFWFVERVFLTGGMT